MKVTSAELAEQLQVLSGGPPAQSAQKLIAVGSNSSLRPRHHSGFAGLRKIPSTHISSELLGLRVRQVDLASRTIRLEVGETKNDAGRLVKMPDQVFTLLSALIAGRKGDDYVFVRKDGKPVKSFRKLWHSVCTRAGVPKLLFHDLRRTGARNLRKLGIAESVCMKVTGHKPPSIFKRYDITDEADMIEVAARLDKKRRLNNSPVLPSSFRVLYERVISAPKDATAHRKLKVAVLPNWCPLNGLDWCPGRESNPHGPFGPRDFKSRASANFATRASPITY